jgi:hypothetical protein
MDLGHHVLAVHDDRRVARGAQRDVQDSPILGQVDPVTAEHRIDALAQAALLGQTTEQRDGLVGDAILRVVQIESDRLRGQALAADRVGGEELAEVPLPDRLVVRLECLPRRPLGQWQWLRHRASLHSFRSGQGLPRRAFADATTRSGSKPNFS